MDCVLLALASNLFLLEMMYLPQQQAAWNKHYLVLKALLCRKHFIHVLPETHIPSCT